MIRLQSGLLVALCLYLVLEGMAAFGAPKVGCGNAPTAARKSDAVAPCTVVAEAGDDQARHHLRRHIRRLELRQAKIRVAVFAMSESEAERKLIDKLKDDPQFKLSDEPIRAENFDYCGTTLTEDEQQILSKQLAHLRTPETFKLTLSRIETEEDTRLKKLINQEAHRIIQASLGDARYREADQQCGANAEASHSQYENRRLQLVYRFLGLNAEQQILLPAVVKEAIEQQQRLYQTLGVPAKNQVDSDERLLDRDGRLPGVAEEVSAPTIEQEPEQQEAQDAEDELIGAAENERISAEFQKRLRKILSREQVALAKEYSDELSSAGGPLVWDLFHLLEFKPATQESAATSEPVTP
jgi:hypothetical protein